MHSRELTRLQAAKKGASSSALEVLNEENRLLKQTIAEAQLDMRDLEQEVLAESAVAEVAAVAAPVGTAAAAAAGLTNAELISGSTSVDFWTPPATALPGGLVETLGPLQPVPSHDGTDCFRWDKSMGGSADHFKVGNTTLTQSMHSSHAL